MQPLVIIANTSWFVSNFFTSSIRELKHHYPKIVVIAPKDDYSDQLKTLGCEFIALTLERSGANPLKEIGSILTIRSAIKKINPCCVLSFTPKINIYSTIAGYTLKVPVISTVSGLGSLFTEQTLTSWVGRKLLKVSQFNTHTVFQNTDDLDTYLAKRLVSPHKTSLVKGIGLDTERFKPQEHKTIETKLRFLMLSRLLSSKGTRIYVQAARDARSQLKELGIDAEFNLLGFIDEDHPQGIKKEEILEWSSKGLINYLGTSSKVEDIIAEHSCVVLPSYYREGMPQCLMEAASMGKPIITTDHTGCRETVEHGLTGLLIKKRCVASLTKAMVKMATLSQEERETMGKRARKKAKSEFCYKHIARHYKSLVDRLHTIDP